MKNKSTVLALWLFIIYCIAISSCKKDGPILIHYVLSSTPNADENPNIFVKDNTISIPIISTSVEYIPFIFQGQQVATNVYLTGSVIFSNDTMILHYVEYNKGDSSIRLRYAVNRAIYLKK